MSHCYQTHRIYTIRSLVRDIQVTFTQHVNFLKFVAMVTRNRAVTIINPTLTKYLCVHRSIGIVSFNFRVSRNKINFVQNKHKGHTLLYERYRAKCLRTKEEERINLNLSVNEDVKKIEEENELALKLQIIKQVRRIHSSGRHKYPWTLTTGNPRLFNEFKDDDCEGTSLYLFMDCKHKVHKITLFMILYVKYARK